MGIAPDVAELLIACRCMFCDGRLMVSEAYMRDDAESFPRLCSLLRASFRLLLWCILRAPPEGYRFFAVLTFTAFVPENCLAICMEDNRVPVVLQRLKESIEQDMSYLSSCPPRVWTIVAQVAGLSPTELHSMVNACYTPIGYMQLHVFAVAEGYPWSLVTCAEEKLQELVDGPDVVEVNCKDSKLMEGWMEPQTNSGAHGPHTC
eukprot:5153077-Amphidinium_carterae.3